MDFTKKLTPTTKTVDELTELFDNGRLDLTPDFQRNSVWPRPAKAYLVDTILQDMPIPLLFLTREKDTNSNRLRYRVIDGQQRIRSAMAFFHNRFAVPNSYGIQRPNGTAFTRVRFRNLPDALKERFIGYSFVVTELSGYNEAELRDIFVRINKYVVRLNPQELRDAKASGPFRRFVDDCAKATIWDQLGIFSSKNLDRKRDKEFIAELAVLLLDGPQDKKGSLDLYYAAEGDQFAGEDLREDLIGTADTIRRILGDEPPATLTRLPVFYGLVGAVYNIRSDEDDAERLGKSFTAIYDSLEELIDLAEGPSKGAAGSTATSSEEARARQVDAELFRRSVSQQTDNVRPRTACIEVLERVIRSGMKA